MLAEVSPGARHGKWIPFIPAASLVRGEYSNVEETRSTKSRKGRPAALTASHGRRGGIVSQEAVSKAVSSDFSAVMPTEK